ncbi:hypothetical protein RISK_002544 [Rhodopirellula islandica]|uniref:Uncharacterized protein n=1 Tax=Rhodopirellula islandica TaxID=595434 RepID=A0A0J1BFI7_RHOIS|nr:hypothetical protein RISK_002544 [Rhodopirellula islandica]
MDNRLNNFAIVTDPDHEEDRRHFKRNCKLDSLCLCSWTTNSRRLKAQGVPLSSKVPKGTVARETDLISDGTRLLV